MLKARFTVLLLVFVVSGCELAEVLGLYVPCSSFNGTKDGFEISIKEPSKLLLDTNSTGSITVEKTWYNKDRERVPRSCSLSFQYEPEGVVEVDRETVDKEVVDILTITPGIAQVATAVGGGGGTKSADFWVAVVPLVNEGEPNNGVFAANELVDGTPKIGYLDNSDDTDWYFADIAPGRVYQFTLLPAVDVTNADPYSRPNYQGELYTQNGDPIGKVNEALKNESTQPARVFVKLTGPIQDDIPYNLEIQYP